MSKPPNELATKYWTIGDRRTRIADTLLDGNSGAVDLTNHTVAFLLKTAAGVVVINNAAATVDSAAAGTVSYAFTAADFTAITSAGGAGTYIYYWVVTRTSDSLKEHFPGDGEYRKITFVANPG